MSKRPIVVLFLTVMVVLSLGLYVLQDMIFHRPVETGFYFFQDLAFLPVNVLLVTLGVNAFISYREKREKLEKVNILVSEFFTESGFDVIRLLNPYVANLDRVNACAASDAQCGIREFRRFVHNMEKLDIAADSTRADLASLRDGLLTHKQNLLHLFGTPNLVEHDRFTDMLWALYHLMDELRSRDRLDNLPQADLKHLSGDIKRAYALLVVEWAYIVRHMKERYPYLYSMASRKNPFLNGDIVIKD